MNLSEYVSKAPPGAISIFRLGRWEEGDCYFLMPDWKVIDVSSLKQYPYGEKAYLHTKTKPDFIEIQLNINLENV